MLNPGDVVDTSIATVNTSSGTLNGLMVSINDTAAVFLENYSNESQVFV